MVGVSFYRGKVCYRYRDAAKMISRLILVMPCANFDSNSVFPIAFAATCITNVSNATKNIGVRGIRKAVVKALPDGA